MENQSHPALAHLNLNWTTWLNTILKDELSSLGAQAIDLKALAEATLRLSNHYVSNPTGKSPWFETWAIQALLGYYHPLNLSRANAVGLRGSQQQFFDGFTDLVDLGCGSGAASLGLRPFGRFERVHLYDQDSNVVERAARLHDTLSPSNLANAATVKTGVLNLRTGSPTAFSPKHLLLLSYVLTELNNEAESAALLRRLGAEGAGGLVIIEPSTSDDARKLQRLRETLMSAGFHIWAPCTHREGCPLLLHSEKDWCHDRTVPFKPDWWTDLEARLPIKNETVTFSYLLARREPPQASTDMTRVIGDTLIEKGKNRQLICRSTKREFLSWFPQRLPKDLADLQFKRGDLFCLSADEIGDQRGAENSIELRIKSEALQRLKELLER